MKFVVLDGSGFLFRAYYGYPALTDNNGNNINVIYGFFRMMLRLFEDNPEYFAVTWDLPVPTQRHKMFLDYKANRPELPNDLKYQIPIVHNIVKEMLIPNFGVPGYEADDVIATLIKISKDNIPDLNVEIVSSDKDLKQLLQPNVTIKDPMKGISIDAAMFIKEYGFEPQHMVDYLALVGDAADNIKGVAGIGPKGAADLIKKYQTIENIYNNLDQINGGIKDKLIDSKEAAIISKKLVELLLIEGLDSSALETCKYKLNIDRVHDVLVKEYKFASMEKILADLKKKLYTPRQTGLF